MNSANYWIDKLALKHIDLGGFFGSAFASNEITLSAALPERFNGDRRYYSSNYYLLQDSEVLFLHRLNQDEMWFFHTGSAVKIHIFSDAGIYKVVTLGIGIDKGESLQVVAPHNHWFGAELVLPNSFILASCSLSPGFDIRDSAQPITEEIMSLKKLFPDHISLIDRLTGCVNNIPKL